MTVKQDIETGIAQLKATTALLEAVAKSIESETTTLPPVVTPPTIPNLNRQLIGFAIPDGELLNNTVRLDRVAATGARLIRTDFRWERVQRTVDGAFDFSAYGPLFDDLRARNIHVLAILGGLPPGKSNRSMSDAADVPRFARYCAAATSWLKTKGVNTVQIWNEPNLDQMNATNYTRAAKAAYLAIKAASPTTFVVSAGLSAVPTTVGTKISVRDWMTRCYALGLKGHYDALAIHPYCNPYNLDHPVDWTGWGVMVHVLRDIMLRNGDDKTTVWATETGFPTDGVGDHTEANQDARYAVKLVAEMRKLPWLGPVCHYGFEDRDATAERESRFGLYTSSGRAKPALATIRQAIASFPAI